MAAQHFVGVLWGFACVYFWRVEVFFFFFLQAMKCLLSHHAGKCGLVGKAVEDVED